ncbi:MAG: response regulator [Bacteroidota bacterium]
MSSIDPNGDILIVDDAATSLNVLTEVLNDAGYKVRPVTSGKSALRSVQAKLPALILLDVRMPDIDGYEVCRILKADEKTRSIPIIFISALGDEHQRVKGFQVGGVDYVTKPFSSEEVLARVNVHLTLQRMQLDLEEKNTTLVEEIKIRKQVEDKLTKAHDFYLGLLNYAPALIWRSGVDEKCDWFNVSWLAFTGRTIEQEIGDGWAEGVYTDDLNSCVKTHIDAFTARRTFEMQYRLRRHDGQFRWIVEYGIPFNSTEGEFAGFIGYCFDITERKQAEAEREKLINELQAALAEIKTLSGLIPICAWCKKIRDDKGYWTILEAYLNQHSSAQFTHGICPECLAKLYPNLINTKSNEQGKK